MTRWLLGYVFVGCLVMIGWAVSAAAATATQETMAEVMAAATDAPGPELEVDEATLAALLTCYDAVGAPRPGAVLLVHGTGLTARESWRKTYVPALTNDHYATCTVTLPERALGDVQVSSEYVVSAVRSMYAQYGNRINVITHSQGALEARWAIRFWPDVRDKIDDLIMLSGSNHGTLVADVVCLQKLKGCTPSVAQQRPQSDFLAVLNNDDETPGDVDYTSIFSYTDEIVITRYGDPSPALDGATNIAVQNLCAFRPVQHIAMITSSPVYAIARDALDNDGPADLSRIDRRTACQRLVAADMQPISGLINTATYLPAAASIFLTRGADEPQIMIYAGGDAPAGDQSPRSRSLGSLLASDSSLRR